jgi:hypothetical protein
MLGLNFQVGAPGVHQPETAAFVPVKSELKIEEGERSGRGSNPFIP